MGLVTGSGIQGMSGIAHVTGTWVNPLLDVTREEIDRVLPVAAPAAADRSDERRHPVPAQRDPAPRDSPGSSAPSAGTSANRWCGPLPASVRTPTS